MLPKWHILLGALFTILVANIFKIGPLNSLLIFLSSFLIDFDHYLYYVYKKRSFSLKKAYFFLKKRDKELSQLSMRKRSKVFLGYFIFHGLETIFLLLLLGFLISPFFFYISLGAFFHLATDIFHKKKARGGWGNVSLIYDFIKFRKMKSAF